MRSIKTTAFALSLLAGTAITVPPLHAAATTGPVMCYGPIGSDTLVPCPGMTSAPTPTPSAAHAVVHSHFAVTIRPQRTSYGRLTTITAQPGRWADNCSLMIVFRVRYGRMTEDFVQDAFSRRAPNSSGRVSWVWVPAPPPADGVRVNNQEHVEIDCMAGLGERTGTGKTTIVVQGHAGKHSPAQRAIYRFWKQQLENGSTACFGDITGPPPATIANVEQVLSDCTTGFRSTPPPDSLLLDPHVQTAYQAYLAAAQDEAAMASGAINSQTLDDGPGSWAQQARDDLGKYQNAMATLDGLYS